MNPIAAVRRANGSRAARGAAKLVPQDGESVFFGAWTVGLKVFIGWSGATSHEYAEAIRAWLPQVLPPIRPWLSSVDISAGSRWRDDIAAELKRTHVGIICVTPDNLAASWPVFEAGALAKGLSVARVIPLLCQVTPNELPDPLQQFQAVLWSDEGLFRLATALNDLLGKDALRLSEIEERFATRLEDLPNRNSPVKQSRKPRASSKRKSPPLKLSQQHIAILLMAVHAPEERHIDSVDLYEVAEELSVPEKQATLYLNELTAAKVLKKSEGSWSITDRGTAFLLQAGLLR